MLDTSVYPYVSFEMPEILVMFLDKLRDHRTRVREVTPDKVSESNDPYASFEEADAFAIKDQIAELADVPGLIVIGHYCGSAIAKVVQCIPAHMRHLVVITSHEPLDEKQLRVYGGLQVRHFALRERHDDESGTLSFLELFTYFAETGKILEKPEVSPNQTS